MQTFDPNQVSFDEGLERIRAAAEKADLDTRRVITSRDAAAVKATELLTVTAVPGGFRKWQLPVHLSEPSQLFVTVAEPNVEVPEHAHEEGDGIRFIASGSIEYKGTQLSTGDWMFIPKGERYSFRVGPVGAVMCYCYCCCCAGRADLFADRGGPVEALGA
jgi:redox-sensitive bicupin YhaK (pirin superfamily)